MSAKLQDPEAHGLKRVGGRPPLKDYLTEVLRRREFITSLARFRIQADNQQNSLGVVWVVLSPVINAMILGFMFGFLMDAGSKTPSYIAFLLVGVFLYEFFSGSLNHGSKSIVNNKSLVQSLAFPRMVLPISAVTQKFIQMLPTIGLMLVVLVFMGHRPNLGWLLLVPLLALYYFMMLGLVLITARLTVHIRDLVNLIPVVTRFFFYTTGTFFNVRVKFSDYPQLLDYFDYQPVYAVLTLGRSILIDTDPLYEMHMKHWWIVIAWAVVLMVVGVIFFWKAEERYGRVD